MRTIKYRGRDHKGKWHIGSLIGDYDSTEGIEDFNKVRHEIHLDTIGQLVCRATEDTPEIWEGDVIEICGNDSTLTQRTVIEWSESQACFAVQLTDPRSGDRVCYPLPLILIGLQDEDEITMKVIGNIHDSPELLKSNGITK